MVLSARFTKQSEESRTCDECGWYIGGSMLRLYGFAHTGDTPHTLYFHPDCVNSTDEKVLQALIEYEKYLADRRTDDDPKNNDPNTL